MNGICCMKTYIHKKTDRETSTVESWGSAGHALGIWICGCSPFFKRELWASKSAGAPHSTKSLKISGCKRWCPKDLWVHAPAAPMLMHTLVGSNTFGNPRLTIFPNYGLLRMLCLALRPFLPKWHFKSELSMSKIIWIFLIFFSMKNKGSGAQVFAKIHDSFADVLNEWSLWQ